MLHLTRVIDRATGYVYVPPVDAQQPEGTIKDVDAPSSVRPNMFGLMSSAAGPITGKRSDVRDVQERWIDAKEEWDEFERAEWRREGEFIRRATETKDDAHGSGKIRERL
jgi:GPN-loop GTPase